MFCLGNKLRSFCHFWVCTKALHFSILLTLRATPFLLMDSCLQWWMLWSSELNLPIPIHFSSLIPKMLMFTLAISSLTTSNLPWFMDLTFQVPMQYYLQYQNLLLLPDTPATRHHFSLGLSSPFFLELFLWSSPVAYWIPTDLGGSSFSVMYFCLSVLFIGFSRVEYWSALPFLSTMVLGGYFYETILVSVL